MDAWQGLRQKLDPLFGKVQLLQVKAGHVAAGPGEALYEAQRERVIIDCYHYDRHGNSRPNRCLQRALVGHKVDIDFPAQEFLDCACIAPGLMLRIYILHGKVLALDISEFT